MRFVRSFEGFKRMDCALNAGNWEDLIIGEVTGLPIWVVPGLILGMNIIKSRSVETVCSGRVIKIVIEPKRVQALKPIPILCSCPSYQTTVRIIVA
jgi:hypothetical protein